MTLEFVHRHETLAPESGIEFMAPISGVCVIGLRRDMICPIRVSYTLHLASVHVLDKMKQCI